MSHSLLNQISQAVQTSFIDARIASNAQYRPELLLNHSQSGEKVLTYLTQELKHCESFCISVAFITLGGLTPLLGLLKELENKGIPGKIITTDYLNFTSPAALDKLSGLKNIELKFFRTSADSGFHTKGYIFQQDNSYRIIIGSSNWTQKALTLNHEWNTRLVSMQEGAFAQQVLCEFNRLWSDEQSLDWAQARQEYIQNYQQPFFKALRENSQSGRHVLAQKHYEPNAMQNAFVSNLLKQRNEGVHRSLLISATGTGKTFASAFALKRLGAQKALFVVHREQIARKSCETFKKIFGSSRTMGVLSGNSDKERVENADFLFATIQTLSKDANLNKYAATAFDVIVIDEVHHAAAASYEKILNYFTPKLWLGMTASPDRPDGGNIYEIFDHNIAYEIRLEQALEANLLCPFHYFGITDIDIDGKSIDDELKVFSSLETEQRVNHVLTQAKYYGYSGDRVKGLIFCRTIKEAQAMSEVMNQKGLKTCALSGSDSQEVRERAIDRLNANGQDPERLDYILTVGIFNEGVDIPEINQVIMLRPTESPIVFIQQLGRGLRKSPGKEFVTILDFIGNYQNNYMIPIALSGDRTYNKDTMRRYVSTGTQVIPGASTLYFDEVSRQKIFDSIDKARTQELKLVTQAYTHLKNKLGRIPSMMDFEDYGSLDVTKIFLTKKNNKAFGSYYQFLEQMEPENTLHFSATEHEILANLSTKFGLGKSVLEITMLKQAIDGEAALIDATNKALLQMYERRMTGMEVSSMKAKLSNEFEQKSVQPKWQHCVYVKEGNGELSIAPDFKQMLKANPEFKQACQDILSFALKRYDDRFKQRYLDTNFCLYEKYTYDDVCRLLNWSRNLNGQNIGGYFYDKETRTLPVFINYNKDDGAIQYEDRFVSPTQLIALSKRPRKVTSSDADHIFKRTREDQDNRIFLFVRKNKDDKEAKEFYFLGEIKAQGEPISVSIDGKPEAAFEIDYRLMHPVRGDIYEYLTDL